MGSWFADLMEPVASEVFCVGRKTGITPVEMAKQCDVVVISVPIADTVKVIRELGPLVSENGLLMDLTSIKKGPVEAMLKYSHAEVVGAHPLFGLNIGADSKFRIALCPGRGQKGLNWLKGVLTDADLSVTVLPPQEHDDMMGLIQGVNHFSTLALGLCISRSGFKLEDLKNCSTQTFKERLDRISSILGQPAELFGSLLMDNTQAGKFIDRYLHAAKDLANMSRKKDKDAFEYFFEMLKEFFSK